MSSINNEKPVILIVTGAWHPPQCYEALKTELTALGYKCVIPLMPSMGHAARGVSWRDDKNKILGTAAPYFEEGRQVVLVGHSYGGIPSAASTQNEGVQERAARGLKGGFHSIIFLAAFAVPVRGWDLLTTLGGQWPEWQENQESYTKNKLSNINSKAFKLLYDDATSEDQAKEAWANVLPHSQDAFETPIDFVAADITIPKTYLVCEKDKILPVLLQEQLVKSTPGLKEARMAAGHSPFVGKAAETAKLLVDIVEGRV
ncbi:hypothetical protein ACHAPJ_003242 [Fusarium lateritium]